MEVLKVVELHIGFKPFIPQGESGNCVFSSSATVLPWVGVYGDSVSQTLLPILMCFFLVYLMCRSCSPDFWFSFSGNCLRVTVVLVRPWEKVSSRPSVLPS